MRSMMSVSCGWRSAMRAKSGNLRKKHDGKPCLLGCRPEPISGAVGEPDARLGRVESQAHAEHARLLLPYRQQRKNRWVVRLVLAYLASVTFCSPVHNVRSPRFRWD